MNNFNREVATKFTRTFLENAPNIGLQHGKVYRKVIEGAAFGLFWIYTIPCTVLMNNSRKNIDFYCRTGKFLHLYLQVLPYTVIISGVFGPIKLPVAR